MRGGGRKKVGEMRKKGDRDDGGKEGGKKDELTKKKTILFKIRDRLTKKSVFTKTSGMLIWKFLYLHPYI